MNFDKESKSSKQKKFFFFLGGGGGGGGGGGVGSRWLGREGVMNTIAVTVVILVWDTSSRPVFQNCKVL